MNKFACLIALVIMLGGMGQPAFATHSESLPIIGSNPSNGQPVMKIEYDSTDGSYIQLNQIRSRTSSGFINFADADGDEADVTINVSGTLNLDGTLSFDSGGAVELESGAGLTCKSGSTVDIAGTVDFNSGADVDFESGSVTSIDTGATLNVSGTLNSSGTISVDAGTLEAESGASVNFKSGSTTNIAGTFQVGGVAVTSTAAELNTLDLSTVLGLRKVKVINVSSPPAAEVDSGWNLPEAGYVCSITVSTTTPEVTAATKTIDVGTLSSETGGDVDCFADGIYVDTRAVSPTFVTAFTGANETYLLGTTYGVSLRNVWVAGSDTAGDHGVFIPRTWGLTSGAGAGASISYTPGAAMSEWTGAIIIEYVELVP